ncbi:MAG: DUF4229 domain-containing protein [Frankiaceae bacterium]
MSTGRTVATYTVGRLAIFVALTAVLLGIGLGIVVLTGHRLDGRAVEPVALAAAFVAAPLSMVVSYFALARQREVMTGVVADRLERYRVRAAARTAAEDAYAERLAGERHRDREAPPGGS